MLLLNTLQYKWTLDWGSQQPESLGRALPRIACIRQVRTHIQQLRVRETQDGTCQGGWNLGPGLWIQQLSSPSFSVLVMVVKCLKMTQLTALITCMFKFLSVGKQAELAQFASWEIGARDPITHLRLYSCYVLFTARCDWFHGCPHLWDECGLLKLLFMVACEKAVWEGCWETLCCYRWGWTHLSDLD